MEDGAVIQEGMLPKLYTPPHGCETVTIPFKVPEKLKPGVEYHLVVRYRLSRNTLWTEKGYEVGWTQFRLQLDIPPGSEVRADEMPFLNLKETDDEITISGERFKLTFDKDVGCISSLIYEGINLIKDGPRLNVWRAPTDNDAPRLAPLWRRAGLDRLKHIIEGIEAERISDQSIRVVVKSSICVPKGDERFTCIYDYRIYGSGDIIVEVNVKP
jgi:beta-galactosidase/beta-glucuronidase